MKLNKVDISRLIKLLDGDIMKHTADLNLHKVCVEGQTDKKLVEYANKNIKHVESLISKDMKLKEKLLG